MSSSFASSEGDEDEMDIDSDKEEEEEEEEGTTKIGKDGTGLRKCREPTVDIQTMLCRFFGDYVWEEVT